VRADGSVLAMSFLQTDGVLQQVDQAMDAIKAADRREAA